MTAGRLSAFFRLPDRRGGNVVNIPVFDATVRTIPGLSHTLRTHAARNAFADVPGTPGDGPVKLYGVPASEALGFWLNGGVLPA